MASLVGRGIASRVVVGVVLVVMVSAIAARFRPSKELPVYVQGAARLLAGEQIYVVEPKAMTYPPFFVLPFTLLTPFGEPVQRTLWWAANLGMLIAIVALIGSLIRPSLAAQRGTRVVYAVVVGLLSAKFVLSPLEHQSHDLIILLLVLLSAYCAASGRSAAAGSLAGIAAACKATPLLLLPYFLWRRMWLAAAAMVCIGAAATLLPDLISPNPAGKLWVQTWIDSFVSKVDVAAAPEVEGAWEAWNSLNQSLVGSVHRWFTTAPAGRINVAPVVLSARTIRGITLGAQALVLLLIGWATRPVRRAIAQEVPPGEYFLAHYGLVLCGMLLLSPMSSTPHFSALLVPIAVLVAEAFRQPRNRTAMAGLIVILLFGALSARDLIGRFLADRIQAFGGATLCTIACLVFLAWVARNWVPASGSPSETEPSLTLSGGPPAATVAPGGD